MKLRDTEQHSHETEMHRTDHETELDDSKQTLSCLYAAPKQFSTMWYHTANYRTVYSTLLSRNALCVVESLGEPRGAQESLGGPPCIGKALPLSSQTSFFAAR
jgi:hypothetical protein